MFISVAMNIELVFKVMKIRTIDFTVTLMAAFKNNDAIMSMLLLIKRNCRRVMILNLYK